MLKQCPRALGLLAQVGTGLHLKTNLHWSYWLMWLGTWLSQGSGDAILGLNCGLLVRETCLFVPALRCYVEAVVIIRTRSAAIG